jgi:hypothetical protein
MQSKLARASHELDSGALRKKCEIACTVPACRDQLMYAQKCASLSDVSIQGNRDDMGEIKSSKD